MRYAVAKSLSPAQRTMLLEGEPDDVTGCEGLGVELRTAQQYSTAKALERRSLGQWRGGDELPGMYWSNANGLEVRRAIILGV